MSVSVFLSSAVIIHNDSQVLMVSEAVRLSELNRLYGKGVCHVAFEDNLSFDSGS